MKIGPRCRAAPRYINSGRIWYIYNIVVIFFISFLYLYLFRCSFLRANPDGKHGQMMCTRCMLTAGIMRDPPPRCRPVVRVRVGGELFESRFWHDCICIGRVRGVVGGSRGEGLFTLAI